MLQSTYFFIKNLHNRPDAKTMKKKLNALYGVLSVQLDNKSDRLGIDYDTTGVTGQQLADYLGSSGYPVNIMQNLGY